MPIFNQNQSYFANKFESDDGADTDDEYFDKEEASFLARERSFSRQMSSDEVDFN